MACPGAASTVRAYGVDAARTAFGPYCVWLDAAGLKLVVAPARVLLEGRRGRVAATVDHPGACTCGN